jgi:ABC-type transport system involved in multi-copper enzyme maturation permease subunit
MSGTGNTGRARFETPSLAAAIARGGAHLLGVTLRRQLFSRQTLIGLALTLVCGLIVVAWSLHREPTTRRLAQNVLVPSFIAFLMPVLAVGYGAAGIGAEREDRTLIYVLMTPIPRPVTYLIRFIAAQILVVGATAGTLWTLCAVAGAAGDDAWPLFWPASLLGGSAYAALFLLVGAIFRHGTIISLAYWFFLEVLFGNMPGIIKRVSVAFYVRSMIYEAGADLQIGPRSRVAKEMFLAVTADTARTVLLSATAGLLVIGVIAFSRREYRDVS